MVSKFENIESYIKNQEKSFYYYIKDFLLDQESFSVLETIAEQTDVYVFSGVIRNFFLGYLEVRDLDIVIKKNKNIRIPFNYIKKIIVKKNSFDGYKLKLNKVNIDVWYLQNTWGIIEKNVEPTSESLINSAFFNFSAIIYNFNKREFVFSDDFCLFLKYNYLDVVYEKNPNIPLCIINTIYYIEKFEFNLGNNLCKWIVRNYSDNYNYGEIQIKHFGSILYSTERIYSFYLFCKNTLTSQFAGYYEY